MDNNVCENALATMKHYVNVIDNYKNNNCSKYLLYTQHCKEIKKNFEVDLYPQGAYSHIGETKALMSMKQLNFNTRQHVAAQCLEFPKNICKNHLI